MTQRFRVTRTLFLPACALAALLAVTPSLAPQAHAADFYIYGGGGGGGGGGSGSAGGQGGATDPMVKGGSGGTGTFTDGGGGGGGSGGFSDTSVPDGSMNGKDASGTAGGDGGNGTIVEFNGSGGSAASSAAGGNGGNGGIAKGEKTSATPMENIVVYGGNGGDAGAGAGGNGGDGGSAKLTISATTVTADKVRVVSGKKGNTPSLSSGSGGAGGSASLQANTLAATDIELNRHDGNLAVNVTALDVGDGHTSLKLANTTAATSAPSPGDDGVYIGTAKLGDGSLTVDRAEAGVAGTAHIKTLQLKGGGQLNENNGSAVTLGKLDIDGGTLNKANWSGIVDHAYTTSDIAINSGGATVNLGAGEDKTLSRVLTGSGGLTKTGAGTLTLSGANTYSGMTTVMSGTLKPGSGVTLASSSGLTLYGGASFDNAAGAHSLNNKQLNVNGANGRSATYIGNLSAQNATLNFISPVKPTLPLLHVTGTTDVSGSAYNMGLTGGTSLAAGSTLTLLKSDGTLTASNLHKGSGIIQIGSTVAHDITGSVTVDPAIGTITATVPQGQATPGAKALSEGWLGGMALNLQGADLIAGRGMESAVRSAENAGAGNGFAGFGALSGGSLRYNTGSHVDMNSLSLLTGLAWGVDLTPGRLTVGAFFEYGNGSYDTRNSFSNAASVDGDGNAYYLGGGLLARMDFSKTGPGRFYAEASGRMGKTHNEYDSSDLRDASGRKAEYDSDTPYYGLHVGAGYVWEINDKASLDLYGKYFWTRQQGDSLTLSTGEHLSFEDADSSRLRFGGRFAYAVNEHVAPYVGAAWEHEFDGKARATTNGFDIDAPSLCGDSGIGELGLSLTPSVDLPLTVDLGVQGYAGQREGVTGSVRVKWEF